jgi:predicted GNAT family acetyltransferase
MRSVGVVTLPAWRGAGAGRAVVSALTAEWLRRGAILHYQTLRANLASVAIARALGYVDMATALAVRLAPDASAPRG